MNENMDTRKIHLAPKVAVTPKLLPVALFIRGVVSGKVRRWGCGYFVGGCMVSENIVVEWVGT